MAAGGADEQPVTLEYRSLVEEQMTEVICCCCFSFVFSLRYEVDLK